MLAGCSGNETIGIIGGADGPTSIIVSEKINGEKLPVRLAKINGEIYYDTGRVSENTPRCGTLDGSLLNCVGEFETPQENNQSNFGPTHTTYFGYQAGFDKYTVEIPADGWQIFRKITDPGFDGNKYKYCVRLKGILPNAESESEIIVFSNEKDLTFGEVVKSIFSSNSNDSIDMYYFFPDEENLSWGIGITAEKVSSTGCRLVISQEGGYPSGQLQTGDWYQLERLDGEWKPVETVISDYGWNQPAYLIPENGKYETEVNWEWLYGKLPRGNYRLAKEIMDFRETGDFDKKVFYAYFEIE